MHYDPIKNIFAGIIKKIPALRILFYSILNIMFLRSWYVRKELKELRKIFGDAAISIFDAGSGYAQYTYFMCKHLQPCLVYSVDIKEEWIEDSKQFFESRNINNVRFGVEDLTQIDYKDEFNIILCVDVMEHIEEDLKVFENFHRALKNNGYLLINTPSVFGGSDVHHYNDESFISEHARDGYSSEDLEAKLKPLGFEIHKSNYTYGFWGDKAWRLGIKYPMVLLGMSRLFFIVLPLYYLITLPFTFLMMYIDYSSNNKIGSGINFIVRKK